jgi:hypothetical protein
MEVLHSAISIAWHCDRIRSKGIEAAGRAGMIAIAVPNRFTVGQDFSKAAAIIGYEDLPLNQIFKD